MRYAEVCEEIEELSNRYQDGDTDALTEFCSRFGATIRRVVRRASRVKSRAKLSPFESRILDEVRLLLGDRPSRGDLNSTVIRHISELLISRVGLERTAMKSPLGDTAAGWAVCTTN